MHRPVRWVAAALVATAFVVVPGNIAREGC
jgi:hypothetical protein